MDNRPNPVTFARYSYYLAYASSGIIVLGLLLGFIRSGLGGIIWLTLITSAAGTFMAWAARRDFKAQPGPSEAMQQAATGWRVNFAALIAMLLLILMSLIFRVLLSIAPRVGGGA